MAEEQLEALRQILQDAGVQELDEVAEKIVALFPKTPAKRPRSDLDGNFDTKRANLSSGSVVCLMNFWLDNDKSKCGAPHRHTNAH